MPFIDFSRRPWRPAVLALVTLLGACGGSPPSSGPPGARPPPPSAPGEPPGQAPTVKPALPTPVHARSWDDFKRHAALRLVAANPGGSYMTVPPEPLLAIPVLEVELESDGRVRRIKVLRQPTQARDTVQLAIDAVHRAAPFGNVAHLPRPWKFAEVFLFDDQRRFKPRTLDD